ncbi:MAG: hypothetical protein H8E17_01810 [Deltaproteobacteria bacterium]|nr:hypothetical protein [Deltaproteobacteria bacterium]
MKARSHGSCAGLGGTLLESLGLSLTITKKAVLIFFEPATLLDVSQINL